MDALHIHRLEARYHLPPSRRSEERRLGRLLEDVTEHRLEAALERLGVPLREEICIREIHVPVRLRLSGADAELALDWSLALAHAIAEAWRRGGPGVVRYPSRVQALVDLAAGVARHDLRRAWAWRQMEIAELDEGASDQRAAEALVSALEREPGFVVPVLVAVARIGRLDGLVRRLPAPAWTRLARAGLGAAGVRGDLELADTPPAEVGDEAAAPPEPLLVRTLERSALAAAAARIAPRLRALPEAARAVAALALLEVDRSAFLRPAAEVRRLLATAEEGFPLVLATAEEPDAGRNVRRRPESPEPDAREPYRPPEAAADTGTGEEAFAGLPRQRGFTHAGGLLFLLGLVEDLGLPSEIAAGDLARRRSLRWALHRLAMALAAVGAADPAALAFAGLGPEDEPPSAGQEPPTDDEKEQLEAWFRRIVAALAEKLERPRTAPEALLAEVCRRRAEIVADPGWIEVHLSLDEVATDVRRRGLDLDPGYLPWLGVVVRFLYT